MPADPPSSPALRASDADRDRIIELLRAALADGRDEGDDTPETLRIRLTGRMKHGVIGARWHPALQLRDGR